MRNSKKVTLVVAIVALALFTFIWGAWHFTQLKNISSPLDSRLQACGSLPNGTATSVVETSRLFINLPKDIYPNVNLTIASSGAMANYISNGGQYGYAIGAQGKPDCWSYYFEFDLVPNNQRGSGTVDLSSKSAMSGMPDYVIHIHVTGIPASDTITTSTSGILGTVNGQVLLGPTCPVEHIPPDPGCAPKPYAITLGISKNLQTPKAFKTVISDASGMFSVPLPGGEYLFYPQATSTYPRCDQQLVTVVAGKTSNIIINCETGIR